MVSPHVLAHKYLARKGKDMGLRQGLTIYHQHKEVEYKWKVEKKMGESNGLNDEIYCHKGSILFFFYHFSFICTSPGREKMEDRTGKQHLFSFSFHPEGKKKEMLFP